MVVTWDAIDGEIRCMVCHEFRDDCWGVTMNGVERSLVICEDCMYYLYESMPIGAISD